MTVVVWRYSVIKAQVYDAPSFDLANMWQSSWNVAHGHGFTFTDALSETQLPRLSIHSDYILLLLAPLTWVWPHWTSFLLVQALVVASGAWMVWLIARPRLGQTGLALGCVAAYLLYGPLLFPVLWQFHGVTLAVTFILGVTEAILNRRSRWVFWLWFGLALMCKEQVGFLVGLWSAWLWWRQGNKRLAGWALGLGWGFSLLHFLVIIPAARSDGGHFVWQYYYGDLGSTNNQRVSELFHPAELLQRFGRVILAKNILWLLLPLGFLPLLSPLTMVAGLALLPYFLTNGKAENSLYFHNYVLAVPFLVVGMIDGLRKLRQRLGQRAWRPSNRVYGSYLFFWIVIGMLAYSPWPGSMAYSQAFLWSDPNIKKLEQWSKQLPASAAVAHTKFIPPIFRNRAEVFILPHGLTRADYVIIFQPQTFFSIFPNQQTMTQPWSTALQAYVRQSPAFVKEYDDTQTLIYRRRQEIPTGPLPTILQPKSLSSSL